jgi:hypothetical protein
MPIKVCKAIIENTIVRKTPTKSVDFLLIMTATNNNGIPNQNKITRIEFKFIAILPFRELPLSHFCFACFVFHPVSWTPFKHQADDFVKYFVSAGSTSVVSRN